MSDKKPSLEELLQFKKSEHPSDASWERFERTLHREIIKSVVQRAPWWKRFARKVTANQGFLLPAGAAATFLLTFVPMGVTSLSSIKSQQITPVAAVNYDVVSDATSVASALVVSGLEQHLKVEPISAKEQTRLIIASVGAQPQNVLF